MSGGGFMIGRTDPHRRLAEAIDASTAGRRDVVLVSGEAGMGKTTLIRYAIDTSPTAPALGWGTCWHGEGAPGFWPWIQAFDNLVHSVGQETAIRAARHDRELLSVVARSLKTTSIGTEVAENDRVLLLDAVNRWLETLADERPVIIVLDDLQWADPSTLDLLELVATSASPSRLLIVGGYRNDEIDAERKPRIARLSGRAEHIHISGLSPLEVGQLATAVGGTTLTTDQQDRLHRRTGGHPMFVTELAQLAALGDSSIPAAVTDAVARRLDRLNTHTRTALDAAGVLGNRLFVDVIAHAIDTTPSEVTSALHPAIDAGLIRREADSSLWFSHDLFRETIYDLLQFDHRISLHGAVADGLAQRVERGGHVEPGDLARHSATAVSLVGVDEAIRWAHAAAAEDRRRSAFREAAFHLKRARIACEDSGLSISPDTLVTLLLAEASDNARAGSPDVARTILHDAAVIATEPGRQADVALAVQKLGAKFAARRDEIITQLEGALTAIEGTDPIREARLTAALARELQHSVPEDRLRAVPLSERALALGRSVGDDATLADCLLGRHDALWGPGTGAERAELGREIAEVGLRLHDTDRQAEGLLLQANGLLESGLAGFRPVLDKWFGILEKRDQPRDRYMILTRRTALALMEGRTSDADSLMHESAVIGAGIHEPDTGNVLMSHRVALTHALDDPDEYRRLAVDAIAHWTGTPVHAQSVAAGALAAAGDLDAAAQHVAMVAGSGGWSSEGSYLRSVLVAHLAAAAVATNDVELCEALLEEVEPLAGHCGVNGAIVAFAGPFDHTAAVLSAAAGDQERAKFLVTRSIDTSRRLGAKVWVRAGEDARALLTESADRSKITSVAEGDTATLRLTGSIWNIGWRDESGNIRHVKGIGDIVKLVSRPGVEVTALMLANPELPDSPTNEPVIDIEALAAYRTRLDQLDQEIDDAGAHSDAGRVEFLQDEREALLIEVRRSTGLGGRVRVIANAPAERARKAVSARIRDAINRIREVAPGLASHLDRSIRTGLRCRYEPEAGEDPIVWRVFTDQT